MFQIVLNIVASFYAHSCLILCRLSQLKGPINLSSEICGTIWFSNHCGKIQDMGFAQKQMKIKIINLLITNHIT